MLTRIHIRDFRLCADATIEGIGSVVALAGRNGAGKSNILQAIAQTCRLATSSDATGLSALLTLGARSSVELDFSVGLTSYRYRQAVVPLDSRPLRSTLEEALYRMEGAQLAEMVHRRGGVVRLAGRKEELSIGEFSPCLPAISSLLPATDQAVIDIKPAASFLSGVHYYPLNEPIEAGKEERIIPDADYARWALSYESTGNADGLLMRILYMQQKRPDDFAAFEQLVGPNGLSLIDKVLIDKLTVPTRSSPVAQVQEIYVLRFVPSRGMSVPTSAVDYNALSLGTRRVIRLMVSMLFDASSVMLVEQPEDSLHQGLTKKVIGVLRQNASPAQLIFSSHSSALLNKLRPEEIQLVSLHNGLTEVRRLTADEKDAAIKFMNEEGPLYDFLDSLQED